MRFLITNEIATGPNTKFVLEARFIEEAAQLAANRINWQTHPAYRNESPVEVRLSDLEVEGLTAYNASNHLDPRHPPIQLISFNIYQIG